MKKYYDYALDHIGAWRDGQAPNVDTEMVIVSWDTKHDAYLIRKEDHNDFLFWLEGIDGWEDADVKVIKLEDAA
jgi:hypothetical protein